MLRLFMIYCSVSMDFAFFQRLLFPIFPTSTFLKMETWKSMKFLMNYSIDEEKIFRLEYLSATF